MNRVVDLTVSEADLIVSVLAERAVNEMTVGRAKQAQAALDLAQRVGADS